MKYIFLIIVGLLTLNACNLERNVEVNLPEYTNELVVECYLEPGQPYRLSLSESISYFEIPGIEPVDLNRSIVLKIGAFEIATTIQGLIDQGIINAEEVPGLPPTFDDATVVITHQGISDTLDNTLYMVLDDRIVNPDTTDNLYFKYYNFGSSTIVPADYDNEFFLSVIDDQGRTALAQTKLLPPISHDSLVLNYNDENLASLQTWFTDPAADENFYRRLLNKNSLYSRPQQDFSLDDVVVNGDDVVFGTGFDYETGDTLIATLYHIDEAYYDFLETFSDAANANGNPFAQPASILSNIDGGIGIFTGISYERDSIVVQ